MILQTSFLITNNRALPVMITLARNHALFNYNNSTNTGNLNSEIP